MTSAPVAAPLSTWRQDGPRLVFVMCLIALGAVVVASIVAAIAVATGAAVRASIGGEQSAERIGAIAREAIHSPTMVWVSLVLTQASMLACAWLGCRLVRKPARVRLGLLPTGLSVVEGTLLLVATVIPFAIGIVLAWLLSIATGMTNDMAPELQRMWLVGSRSGSVAWVLLIALVPGFVEEACFRGFVQRGLLLRWSATGSILTSSLLFAAMHPHPVWALAVFPLGVWLGVVAWRTGSVVLPFAMHASVNGLWTAGMMIAHREPASETMLRGLVLALLALGVVAMPWALAILRRQRPVPMSELDSSARESTEGRPESAPRASGRLLPRVAAVAAVAAALFFMVIPPGVPDAPTRFTIGELEARTSESAVCRHSGESGAAEFVLSPGVGIRVALPSNRVGVDEVIVMLDPEGQTVWLAYNGDLSGKGVRGRPLGIVEQLAAGDPTTIWMTLAEGSPPVAVRLVLEESEEARIVAFERAAGETGWATRGRR